MPDNIPNKWKVTIYLKAESCAPVSIGPFLFETAEFERMHSEYTSEEPFGFYKCFTLDAMRPHYISLRMADVLAIA